MQVSLEMTGTSVACNLAAMKIGKKIEALLAAKRSNMTELGVACGVTAQAVQQWIAKDRLPRGPRLQKIADFFEVSVSDLFSDVDGISSSDLTQPVKSNSAFDKNVTPTKQDFRPIPVISAIQAGRLKEISDPYPPGAGYAVEYTEDANLSRWGFALEIEGDSMLPEFRPGDRVIIDPELSPNPGDFVAARNTKEEATFKRYKLRGMDASGNMVFELEPLNPNYPTMRSDIEHLEIIGVMVEHRKKYRRGKK